MISQKNPLPAFAPMVRMILPGLPGFLCNEISRRIYSNESFYGQKFDLTRKFEVPSSSIFLKLRELRESDAEKLFLHGIARNGWELKKRLECLRFIRSGIPAAYVGAEHGRYPCVICWLCSSKENSALQRYFRGGVPLLEKDEVLLEHIYTHSAYRGKKLMAWITLSLFEKARTQGAGRAVSFVHASNALSLKASKKMGWQVYLRKNVTWRLWRRRVAFELLDPCDPAEEYHGIKAERLQDGRRWG